MSIGMMFLLLICCLFLFMTIFVFFKIRKEYYFIIGALAFIILVTLSTISYIIEEIIKSIIL